VIVETSRLLNRLAGALGSDFQNFRNPNGVYMKLGNFCAIDPSYTSPGRKGLTRGGKGDREVWGDFSNRPKELALAAAAITATVESGFASEDAGEPEGISEAPEGRLLTRLHITRERNAKLVAEKKKAAFKLHGRLACEACGFDFSKVYGERGAGFIEAHHLRPLHQIAPGTKTRLEDLVLLCANCHRIIHAGKPWLSFSELTALIQT
jgi:5-methylcytosine-specific restriction protein A